MKKKNLILNSLLVILLLSSFGCKKRGQASSFSSSSSTPILSISILTPDEALEEAGKQLYEMYKNLDGSYVYDDFDLTKKFYIFDKVRIDVSWELKIINGSGEGVKFKNAKDSDNYQGVYIGYYDNVIKEDIEFELIPTLDYKGTSKTLKEILKEDKSFTCKVKELLPSTFEEYISLCKENGEVRENNGKVCSLVAVVLSVSIDGKNIFLHDEEHGYLIYDSKYTKSDFFPGDKVSVIGKCYLEKGCYLMYNPKVYLLSRSEPTYIKPEYVDVTSIYENVASFNDNIVPYQNMRIEISDVELDSIDENNYYFIKNNQKYIMKRDDTYFFNQIENESLFEKFVIGKNANLKGVLRCIDNKYYLIPDNFDSIEIIEAN